MATDWSDVGRYGVWRGSIDEHVRRYLDCGLSDNGFARVRCPDCRAEYLLAFSCKTRELCPSCASKRAAVTAALLREDVLEEVGHAQWVFVMPKMLRLYFLQHRALLGGLARAAWETVLNLMIEATGEETLRPGMVAVVQTSGDLARWHPHVTWRDGTRHHRSDGDRQDPQAPGREGGSPGARPSGVGRSRGRVMTRWWVRVVEGV